MGLTLQESQMKKCKNCDGEHKTEKELKSCQQAWMWADVAECTGGDFDAFKE